MRNIHLIQLKASSSLLIFLVITSTSVVSSQSLYCWTGAESMRYESSCSSVNTNYCVKFASSDLLARSCDTNGQWCAAIGNGCRPNYNYFGAIGTICCCNTNNCNSANSIMITKWLMIPIIMTSIFCVIFLI